jgi:hypothetical protein
MISLENIKKNKCLKAFIEQADAQMEAIGYTEHGLRHAQLVSQISNNILEYLSFPKRKCELSEIAGYLHDIGNVIARDNHPQSGSILVWQILREMKMDEKETALIVGAIGNHEEIEGDVVSDVSAAVILADKSDVHRSRVRNPNTLSFDIHDRVNYAAKKSFLKVDKEKKLINLEITIDTKVAKVMEYFEIFLERMVVCRKAARFLKCEFGLEINEVRLL